MNNHTIATLLLLLTALSGFAGQPKKFSELAKDEDFAKATPEARIEIISKKLAAGGGFSSEVSDALIYRLWMDRLVQEQDAEAHLTAYGRLRDQFKNLPATTDLEYSLAAEYVAASPEGQKNDQVGMMKLVTKAFEEKKISYPTRGSLHTGMLFSYLAGHPEFPKMKVVDKLAFLRGLVTQKAIDDLTASHFAKGIVAKALSEVAADEQKAIYDEASVHLDFFTKNIVGNGYEK